jgi:hypothetical protein
MTKKMIAAGALMIALGVGGGISQARAQESSGVPRRLRRKGRTAKPVEAYRLDFSINELEDGKKINTRQYSMNLTKDQPQ